MPNIALIAGNLVSDSGVDISTANAQSYARLHSGRDFPNGTLIETTIDYSVTNGEPWILEITGNSYGSLVPFNLTYQGYIYNNTTINVGGMSVGTNITGMSLFNYNGKLCFWFPYLAYWQGFNVYVYTALSGRKENRVTAISNLAKPAGITKEISMTFQQVVRTSSSTVGTANYVSKFTGNGILADSQIFDNGTRVGIGTASPAARLDIRGSGLQDLYFISTTGTNVENTIQSYFNNGGAWADLSTKSQNLSLNTGPSGGPQVERLRITSGGDIGINTNNPSGKLDVVGASTYLGIGSSSDTFLFLRGYNGGLVRFQSNTGFSGAYNGLGITTNSNGVNSLPSWNFDFGGQDGVNFVPDAFSIARKPNGGAYSTFLTIRNTGNVGVGTSSPLTRLDIRSSNVALTSLNGNLFVANSETSQVAGNGAQINLGGYLAGDTTRPYPHGFIRGVVESSATNANGGALLLGTMNDSTNLVERVRITKDGNVGIGTTSPLAPLHVDRTVAGTVEADRTTPVDVLILESENTNQVEFTGFGQAIAFRGSTYNNQSQRTIGRILHQINDNSTDTTIGTSLDIQLLSNATGSTLASRFYIAGTGVITIPNLAGTGSRIVVADANGALSATSLSTSVVGGSGTVNRVAKFTATGTIGDSQIFDNGTNVGIGTVTPGGSFHMANVSGAIFGSAVGSIGTLQLTSSSPVSPISGRILFGTDGTGWQLRVAKNTGGSIVDLLFLQDNGNLGIGANNPSAPIHIVRSGGSVNSINVGLIVDFQATGAEQTGAGTAIQFRGKSGGGDIANYNQAQIATNNVGSNNSHGLSFYYKPDAAGALTEGFRLHSNGFVGIGTTSPSSKLSVSNAGAEGIEIRPAISSNLNQIFSYNRSSSDRVPLDIDAKTLAIQTEGTTKLFVSNAGNVGIGTTSPSIPRGSGFRPMLHVYNNSVGTNPAVVVSCEDNQEAGFIAGDNAGGSDIGWGFNAYYEGNGNNFFNIRIGDNGTWTDRFTIDRFGNVGIGTTSPGVKLDVVGSSGVDNYIRVIGGAGATKGGLLIGNNDGAKTYGGLYFDNSNNNVILNQRYTSGYLGLGSNSRTSDLVITSSGNVLVNTTTDTGYKFDVNGTTRFGGTTTFNSTIVQKNFSSIIISNLSASATQARQFEILRGFYDYNDWSTTGVVEIEVYENYYSRGLKKVYTFTYGYYDSSSLFLTEMTGTGDNTFRVTMGAKVLISGDMYYVPVYLEVRAYGRVDVIIRTRRAITTNNLNTVAGTLYVNESPTAVNISDFTSDTIVYPNNAAANQVVLGNLGIGSNPSYKLDVDGVTRFRNFVRFKTNVWNLSDEGQSRFYYENAGSTFYGTGSSHIWRSSADVTLMTLTSTGNLGIATTTPQSLLSISNNHATLLSIGNSAWANKNVLLTNYNGTVGDYTELLVPGSGSNSALLRLTSGGSLGLGIATPTFVTGTGLHVKTAGDANIRITSGSNTGFDLVQAVDGTNYLYNRDNSPFIFGTNNTERLRIAANGSVTIYNATTLSNLAGTGTRMVVADANGLLSTEAIPSGGGGSGTVTSVALAVNTSGNDISVSGSPITTSGTFTLSIPDAGPTARGVVNTGTQTFAGNKTFTGQTSLNVLRTTINDGTFAMYMLATYNLTAGDTNKNVYATVDALKLNFNSGALTGSETYNVTANLNQVSIEGNSTTISTQPIRGVLSGLVGAPGGTTMNISDFRHFDVKIPDRASLTGHIVTTIYGLKIGQMRGATGYTITNGWGVYQEGSQDNNYFNGQVLIGTNVLGNYKLDVNGDVRFSVSSTPLVIDSIVNSAVSGSAVTSVYSTASSSTIAFGSQANDTYLVGGFVFIGNQSAKFMVQADTLTGAYDGWGSIGSSSKYMKEVYTNYLVNKVSFNRQTASYTLVSGDRSKVVEMNVASANTLTVPTNASVAFPVGTQVTIIQYGAGQTTIAGASGVTLRSTNNWLKINARYGSVTLVKVGTDEWYVIGNLSA